MKNVYVVSVVDMGNPFCCYVFSTPDLARKKIESILEEEMVDIYKPWVNKVCDFLATKEPGCISMALDCFHEAQSRVFISFKMKEVDNADLYSC